MPVCWDLEGTQWTGTPTPSSLHLPPLPPGSKIPGPEAPRGPAPAPRVCVCVCVCVCAHTTGVCADIQPRPVPLAVCDGRTQSMPSPVQPHWGSPPCTPPARAQCIHIRLGGDCSGGLLSFHCAGAAQDDYLRQCKPGRDLTAYTDARGGAKGRCACGRGWGVWLIPPPPPPPTEPPPPPFSPNRPPP